MKIKLCFPEASIEAIKALGLRQTNPETLRLITQHSASSHGIGVLLRGKSGEILDGRSFAIIHKAYGAWIECDSLGTKQRVQQALATAVTGMSDVIEIITSSDGNRANR